MPVTFEDLDGTINNCDFSIDFDKQVLEYVSADPAEDGAGGIVKLAVANYSANYGVKPISGNPTINFLFNDATQGIMNITSSGTFANIKFKIKADAEEVVSALEVVFIGAFSGKSSASPDLVPVKIGNTVKGYGGSKLIAN